MPPPPQAALDFRADASVPVHPALAPFHPAVRVWFQEQLGEPTPPLQFAISNASTGPSDDLAGEPTERQRVIAVLRSRFPQGLLSGEQTGHQFRIGSFLDRNGALHSG